MTGWANFFVAVVSAAAALTGLIFVGVSINLTKILSYAKLPNRALESLILLLNIVITGALCLVPGQADAWLGVEFLGLGIVVWVVVLILDRAMLRESEKLYKTHFRQNMLYNQVAILPYIVAGLLFLTHGQVGLYWLVPGILASFIKAIMDAWVLLVEIHR